MASVTVMTPRSPGAVAVLQLSGEAVGDVLLAVTGRSDWPVGRVRLADLAGVDRGLAVRLGPSSAQLMPHGGPGVLRQLLARLGDLGVAVNRPTDPRSLYPEATSAIEAEMLAALAAAASPAAIDLLARQPAIWRDLAERGVDPDRGQPPVDDPRDRLLRAPVVVVVGRPNVGKSTLANALAGRAVSIVADLPGTTRDWVGSLLELPGGVAVQWLDTPGIRQSDDAVEQAAIAAARQVIASAEVLVAMRDPRTPWPDPADLPREPDVRVLNKIDDAAAYAAATDAEAEDDVLPISAAGDRNLGALQSRVLQVLGLDTIDPDRPWRFSASLRQCPDLLRLRQYVGLEQ